MQNPLGITDGFALLAMNVVVVYKKICIGLQQHRLTNQQCRSTQYQYLTFDFCGLYRSGELTVHAHSCTQIIQDQGAFGVSN